MATSIRTVGIVGTGVIGTSWAALFLSKGLRVLVSDPAPGAEEKFEKTLSSMWPALESLGLSEGASMKNYEFVGSSLDGRYDELDYVQENAPEKVELKRKIIAEIDAATKPEVIIASSSSGLPSSSFIQDCKRRPERVLIAHPFNPPHLMPLVEVVPHARTDKAVSEQAMQFYKSMGKRPVLVTQETPGFVANRLQVALVNEAYSLVQRGIVSAEDVDAVVSTGLGPRWAFAGPFMTQVLGGGGGREGFRSGLERLGPARQAWSKDMKAHEYQYTDENADILNHSVQKMLDARDPGEVQNERDEMLIELFKAKAKAKTLV